MKEVADIPTGNVMSGLQGRVAGMNVTTDGKPGGGNTDTKLRGITTINNSSPLYVIDGIQTHDNVASIISSNDVESIQVAGFLLSHITCHNHFINHLGILFHYYLQRRFCCNNHFFISYIRDS